ncbi:MULTISPECIES: hypothetical protein [Caballeronia]|jgi:hypothetical protein|uniref:Lipoprotein n=1 Tax=Caballeronia zhejiangensis TaxID=871203 RepID=A0A656QT48_9BURK|nr:MULTISPECIES: hypothetical protein [Caballeronia]EKS70683.1 hypothetical protein BURK_012233 [Burkholderia sp. SJ98]KDR33733.1 hypothetical protein BG60_00770 [Caballeronia zhejiangensis]MDR5766448.1 hypothetical protein [Caballeronia sp. LZ028]MDR5788592.1 hypothetical protein [Caballeronia sp. LP003]
MRSHQTKRATFLAITMLTCASTFAATAATDADPLAFTVQTPTGGTSRLIYADDDGWRLDDRDANLKPTEARITQASTEPQKEASAGERPMTVFIDGPTGFTYVWIRDQGWKYVGRISGRNH